MIVGIGCDIVQIFRIKKLIEKFSHSFLNRVFTPLEIAMAPSNSDLCINYYAKRFAAKEAFSKALGTGIGSKVSFKEIEIYNNVLGKPLIRIAENTSMLDGKKVHLSLSDDNGAALAFVIIEDYS